MKNEYKNIFKILIIGDSLSGKTSIIQRYIENNFTESFVSTIGVDFKIKDIEIDNDIYRIQLWDTAGQDRFRSIISSYYRCIDCIIICYDITNRQSFENINKWNDEIKKYSRDNITKILFANKIDESNKRVITSSEGMEYALVNNMIYMETSSKIDNNINESILSIIKELIRKNKEKHIIIEKEEEKFNLSDFFC